MEKDKRIEVVSGDGKDLDISPVYEHLEVEKPRENNKKKDIITVLTGSLYAIGEVYKDIEKLKIAQLGNIQ